MDTENLTIKKFSNGLLHKEFSAREVAEEYFRHIEKNDARIGTYLSLLKDEALKTADEVDRAVAGGEKITPLAGVPLAIKDNLLLNGSIATAGSKILEDYKSSYDATVIKKLKGAKAVFLGKTNLDEFAMGSSTENSAFHVTKNPFDETRVPGGSSGGSAAAVGGDLALAALGSDTGGSVRQPAAFCGVVGLKPTYGAVSRFGLIAMASSLDQIGPITKTVEDARILFEAIRGQDPYDATSVKNYELGELNHAAVKRLRIGIPKEFFTAGIEKEVEIAVGEAIAKLKKLRFEFREVSLPHAKYALSCYYIIMPAEVSTNLARFDGMRYGRESQKSKVKSQNLRDIYFKTRGEGFGPETRRRILLGTFVLSAGYYDAYYAKAQKVRRLMKEDFDRAFEEVDVIMGPTTPTLPFKIGERTANPIAMYLSDILTIPANLAGLPAISIPVRKYDREKHELPVGFQLIGKHFREADILGIGELYEKS